ncbi:TIGR04283 family arsenosugar biosynthesis glycosyltransferase [Roseovarius aestuariivivens]|uniref:TIGR04283 family arsenosugar biosynthesis glycosyltransferase n=1 Tax=Roseovarius aestuariivivens TaxID=1888910 RepID=UPI001080D068|nr:TIGR04283 family arsenosugar biosynthesis glycosyltransferase [Roseovarius aestuariivivens]
MPAKLSIVMPTLNAEDALRRSLPALAEGLQTGLIRELVISDGGSTDATLKIADTAGAEIVEGPASRGGQLRRGAEVARGEWLLFLHADTVLPPDWPDLVVAQMARGGPAAFALRFDATGLAAAWVAGWANLRSRLFSLPYGDQGLLVARRTYRKAGGYPDIPLMEDVALARALPRIALMPGAVRTSAARYERDGWLRRGGGNLFRLLRFLLGGDPEKLTRRY